PEQFKLAVLVFLKRATGVQSATVAQPVFAAYARATADTNADAQARRDRLTTRAVDENSYDLGSETAPDNSAPEVATREPLVRVHLVREEITRTLRSEEHTSEL